MPPTPNKQYTGIQLGCVIACISTGTGTCPAGEHHHSGIGLNTPNDVHYGRAQQRREEHARVLVAAHAAHPERFVHGVPTAPALPTAVWINKPIADQSDQIEINSLN